jgi:large subunit ribosomal protein L21
MFAVIKTGGKQYKVAAKDVVCVEKIDGVNAGETISFDTVLMVGEGEAVTVGLPKIAGAVVRGEVLEQRKGDKVLVFKKTRRSTYRRKRGHRQLETVVRITEIVPN